MRLWRWRMKGQAWTRAQLWWGMIRALTSGLYRSLVAWAIRLWTRGSWALKIGSPTLSSHDFGTDADSPTRGARTCRSMGWWWYRRFCEGSEWSEEGRKTIYHQTVTRFFSFPFVRRLGRTNISCPCRYWWGGALYMEQFIIIGPRFGMTEMEGG